MQGHYWESGNAITRIASIEHMQRVEQDRVPWSISKIRQNRRDGAFRRGSYSWRRSSTIHEYNEGMHATQEGNDVGDTVAYNNQRCS